MDNETSAERWPFQWGYVRVAWAFFWLGYSLSSTRRSWVRCCRAFAQFVVLTIVWWRHGDIGPALSEHEGNEMT